MHVSFEEYSKKHERSGIAGWIDRRHIPDNQIELHSVLWMKMWPRQ